MLNTAGVAVFVASLVIYAVGRTWHAFSRRNIVGLQHELYGHVHRWVERLWEHIRAQRAIPLSRAAQCLTLDNVSYFSYGSDEGALDSEGFQSELLDQFDRFPKLVTVFQFFPLLQSLVNILQRFSSSSSSAARVTEGSTIGWDRFIDQKARGETNGMMLFESMLERARKSNFEIERGRGVANGSLMLVAGTGTTAAAITTGVFHLTKQPELWRELKRQLHAAIPAGNTQPDVTELEKLPFMEAVARESLRYGCPVEGTRDSYRRGGGWRVVVSIYPKEKVALTLLKENPILSPAQEMDAHVLYRLAFGAPSGNCTDPTIYSQPELFKPERWLVDDAVALHAMNRHFVVFSNGSRNCIGQK
ncbi:cytochrome P450 [Diaporthe sp. PMI_573]|nr:cytochrome P450 [Diaporthaceae sp. PMI_573]